MQRRVAIAIALTPTIVFATGHVGCSVEQPDARGEEQTALLKSASDGGRRAQLEEKLKELRDKAKRLKERCAELAKRGKQWIKNKDNQHKVCVASCDLAHEWGSEFCDVVGVVCALKIKFGWPLLFCLGAQQICDAGIQNFDVDKCKATCDSTFGSDSGTDAATGDASTDSGSKSSETFDYDWSVFPRDRLAPTPNSPDRVPDAPAADPDSCEGCDTELARLEAEIAELERELAQTP